MILGQTNPHQLRVADIRNIFRKYRHVSSNLHWSLMPPFRDPVYSRMICSRYFSLASSFTIVSSATVSVSKCFSTPIPYVLRSTRAGAIVLLRHERMQHFSPAEVKQLLFMKCTRTLSLLRPHYASTTILAPQFLVVPVRYACMSPQLAIPSPPPQASALQ